MARRGRRRGRPPGLPITTGPKPERSRRRRRRQAGILAASLLQGVLLLYRANTPGHFVGWSVCAFLALFFVTAALLALEQPSQVPGWPPRSRSAWRIDRFGEVAAWTIVYSGVLAIGAWLLACLLACLLMLSSLFPGN